MDIFKELERRYAELEQSGRIDDAISRWSVSESDWPSVQSLDALRRACRDTSPTADYAARDEIFSSLCRLAATDDVAAVLLTGLLRPGLLRVRAHLCTCGPLESEELDAELLAGMWSAVKAIDATTTRIPKRLLNAAHDAGRTAQYRERSRDQRTSSGQIECFDDIDPSTLDSDDALSRFVQLGVLSPAEAALLAVPRGELRQAAAALGLSEGGAASRRHRARAKLGLWRDSRGTRSDTLTSSNTTALS